MYDKMSLDTGDTPRKNMRGKSEMNKFKRIFCVILALLMVAAVLTACGGNNEDKGNDNEKGDSVGNKGEKHTHTSSEGWQVDCVKHWMICEDDGEKFDEAEHDIQAGRCSQCSVEVIKQGEFTNVYFFDDHDNWIRCLHYDDNGNVTEDTVEYTYFEDGNIDFMKLSKNGKLFYEGDYELTADKYNYEKVCTEYNDDGTKTVTEMDEKGDIQREAKYKADGSVEYDHKTVHTYNDKGKKESEKTYDGDKLIKDVKWIVVSEDSWGGGSYKKEVTTYNADGTTTVKVYNENDELLEG